MLSRSGRPRKGRGCYAAPMEPVWRWTLLLGALSVAAPLHAQRQGPEPNADAEQSLPDTEADSEPDPDSAIGPRESEPVPAIAPSRADAEDSSTGPQTSEGAPEIAPEDRRAPPEPPSAEALPPPPSDGYSPPPGYTPRQGWAPAPPGMAAPHRPDAPRRRRIRLRYEEGMTVPPGGSLVTRRNRGLLVPGLIGFTVTYLMNIVGSTLDEDNAIIALPLAGLPIHQARDGDSYWSPMVAVHTLVQAAALALLVAGLIPRRYVEYVTLSDRSKGGDRRWALVPTTTRRGAGLALTVF